jgi:pyruvate formate lyase activating enzyme
MQIQGLQKMTLLDYPGRVACTVFLSGCNFRCPFCHNSELLDAGTPGIMDDAELLAFLKGRKGILEGVAFTGGEPLSRKGLPELLRAIKELGYPVKLDTNGAYPEQLKDVVRAGLVDYVAMDVKNSPARYAETCGLPDMGYVPGGAPKPGSLLAKVAESKDFLIAAGAGKLEGVPAVDYEFRTTTLAQLHDDDSFRAIGEWIRGAKRWFLQPFTDRDTVPFAGLSAPPAEDVKRYADLIRPFVGSVGIRGGGDE